MDTRDARLGVHIITAAPDTNGVLDAVHELDQRGIVFSIGHRYSISNCLRRISVCLLRVYREWHSNIGLRDGSCAPCCTPQSHTSSARCLNCITATRPSLVLLALHLNFSVLSSPNPSPPTSPASLASPASPARSSSDFLESSVATRDDDNTKRVTTMKRHPRLPCLAASRVAGRVPRPELHLEKG